MLDRHERNHTPSAPTFAAEVKALIAEGGWQEGALLIQRSWDAHATTHPEHLLLAIKSLPTEALIESPALVVAASYLRDAILGGDSRRYAGEAIDVALNSRGDHLSRLTLITSRSVRARLRSDLEGARAAAEEGRALAGDWRVSSLDSVRTTLPHLRIQWARSLEAADDTSALAEFEKAYDEAKSTNQPFIARRAAGHLAWYHAERGRHSSTERWLSVADSEKVSNGRHDAILFLADALRKLDRKDSDGAAASLARAVGLGSEYWAAELWVRSLHAHSLGSAATAESVMAYRLQRSPELLTMKGSDGRLFRAARVRILLLRERVPNDLHSFIDLSAWDRGFAAAISHFQGAHRIALDLSRPITEDALEPRLQSNALLVHAAAALALGLQEVAATTFARADAVIQSEGLQTGYGIISQSDLHGLSRVSQPSDEARVYLEQQCRSALSKRENEILGFLAAGLPAATVAEQLFISPNTVKSTVRRIYRKLGINSRQEAIDYARRAGLGRRLH